MCQIRDLAQLQMFYLRLVQIRDVDSIAEKKGGILLRKGGIVWVIRDISVLGVTHILLRHQVHCCIGNNCPI